MKKTRLLLPLFLAAAATFTACSDDNDITKPTDQPAAKEVAELAQANTFGALNKIMRTLAGLDELPDDWQTAVFTPTEGVVVDEANPDVRYVIASSTEGAEQYFQDLCPDLDEGSTTWSNDSVGTLKFTKVNTDKCFATIDVSLKQMPGLKQIRLVPANVIPANSKFSGTPYYHMGDIVTDKKGVYWICVRPSGGPLQKEYAYFVSFDKSLLKLKTQKQDIFQCDFDINDRTLNLKEKQPETSGTWTYATNLADEKIAIAAMHTFAMIGAHLITRPAQLREAQAIYTILANEGYDFEKIFKVNKVYLNSSISLAAAYDTYKTHKSSKYLQEKYIQPVVTLTLKENIDNFLDKDCLEYVSTYHYLGCEKMGEYWAMPTLTSGHTQDMSIKTNFQLWSGEGTAENKFAGGYNVPYNVNDYTIDMGRGKLDVSNTKWFKLGEDGYMLPLVMVQKKITDKGKAFKEFTRVESPLSDFITSNIDFYYTSLSRVRRYVIDKKSGNNGGEPTQTIDNLEE